MVRVSLGLLYFIQVDICSKSEVLRTYCSIAAGIVTVELTSRAENTYVLFIAKY